MDPNGWIDARHDKPKEGVWVLGIWEAVYSIVTYEDGDFVDYASRPDIITHWQPLPEPPKA